MESRIIIKDWDFKDIWELWHFLLWRNYEEPYDWFNEATALISYPKKSKVIEYLDLFTENKSQAYIQALKQDLMESKVESFPNDRAFKALKESSKYYGKCHPEASWQECKEHGMAIYKAALEDGERILNDPQRLELIESVESYLDNLISATSTPAPSTPTAPEMQTDSPHEEPPAKAPAVEIPDELRDHDAMELLMGLVEAGLCDDKFYWKGTQQLLAYFAYRASSILFPNTKLDKDGNKTISWKPFESLFDFKGKSSKEGKLKTAYQNWMRLNTKFQPPGYEKIDGMLKSCNYRGHTSTHQGTPI